MKTIKFNEELHDEKDRCGAATARGACQHLSVEGTNRCPHHGANKIIQKQKKVSMDNYNFTRFKGAGDKATSPTIKSLRDEVGILRQLLENTLNQCEDETQILLNAVPISDMVVKIQKCVEAMTKLDILNERMLEKDELAKFGVAVISIISKYVEDKDVLTQISQDIITELED